MKLKNPKVVVFSILALACIALTFLVSYWFLVGAIVLMLLNQKELTKPKKESKK